MRECAALVLAQRNPATLADTIEIDAPSTTNHAIVITDGTFDIRVTLRGG